MTKVKIYYNPKCGTSHKALVMIREAGIQPEIIEYLKTPLRREALVALLAQMAIPARQLLRDKGELYHVLGLDDPTLPEDALIDAMAKHPMLMNRPVVVTPKGARLCRPCELLQELL